MTSAISPAELKEKLAAGDPIRLIDVRTPAEFREVHVRGAENFPLERLESRQLQHDSPTTLFVICQRGARGEAACRKLAADGVQSTNVQGGTRACEQAGLPVVRGKKTISLERQVRIAAGSLVVVGVAMAALVHPAWIGLTAFVGAGLVFAGVTDTCGMGMLLARMPWNQAGREG